MRTGLITLIALFALSHVASAADLKMPKADQPAAEQGKSPAPNAKEKLFRDFQKWKKKQ